MRFIIVIIAIVLLLMSQAMAAEPPIIKHPASTKEFTLYFLDDATYNKYNAYGTFAVHSEQHDGSSVISINRDVKDGEPSFKYRLAHELSHKIYSQNISVITQRLFRKHYRKDRYSPTDYGKTSYAENFAEIMTHLVLDLPIEDNHKVRFVQNLLDRPSKMDVFNLYLFN